MDPMPKGELGFDRIREDFVFSYALERVAIRTIFERIRAEKLQKDGIDFTEEELKQQAINFDYGLVDAEISTNAELFPTEEDIAGAKELVAKKEEMIDRDDLEHPGLKKSMIPRIRAEIEKRKAQRREIGVAWLNLI